MIRRLAGALAFLAVASAPAWPLAGAQRTIVMQPPGWVNQQAPGAQVAVDFQQGRYWINGAGQQNPLSLFSITRASTGTNLLPTSASGFAYTTYGNNTLRTTQSLGILIEEARTNLLLNSAVPATQTTGSLATGTYILWVNGAGTATMSAGTATGCGTGAASNGTPVTVTITIAGTCTVTVAGLLNAFQLELGAFGTSLVVTAGATATRAADAVTSVYTWFSFSAGTWLLQFVVGANANAQVLEGSGAITGVSMGMSGTTALHMVNRHGAAGRGDSNNSGAVALNQTVKIGMSFDGVNTPIYAANNAAITNSVTPTEADWVAPLSVGSRIGSLWLDNYIKGIWFNKTPIGNGVLGQTR